MPDPAPRSSARLLWPLVIALLLVLTIVWMLSPSGDTTEPAVQDPIVMEDFADPAPPVGALDLENTAPPPAEVEGAAPTADREPTDEPLPVPAAPQLGQ